MIITPKLALTWLKEGNEAYIISEKNHLGDISKEKRLHTHRHGQNPYAVIVTCSDSRVVPEMIFNCTLGDIFVIRTAGNVINEGELATVEYAIEHLKVKHIIVLGHTHCGAVHAAINNEHGMYLDPILRRIRKNISIITNETMAAKMNSIGEVNYLKEKFPNYEGTIESMMYDLDTSEVF